MTELLSLTQFTESIGNMPSNESLLISEVTSTPRMVTHTLLLSSAFNLYKLVHLSEEQ